MWYSTVSVHINSTNKSAIGNQITYIKNDMLNVYIIDKRKNQRKPVKGLGVIYWTNRGVGVSFFKLNCKLVLGSNLKV